MSKEFSVGVKITGAVSPSLDQAVKATESKFAGLAKGLGNITAGVSKMQAAMSTFAGALAAGGIAVGVKNMLSAGDALNRQVIDLTNAGRSLVDVNAGLAESWKILGDIPTASVSDAMGILKETISAFGDFHHAVENLRSNVKLGEVFRDILHLDDPGHALGSLVKTAEILGKAQDPEKYKHFTDQMAKAITFSGGRLTPDEMLTFARNAQVAGSQLNDRFIGGILPSLVGEYGGEHTASGLKAFRTIISGRKLSNNAQAKAWADLGLINMQDVVRNKMGDVKGWRDGAVRDTRLAYQDPLKWMEQVILPRLQKKGVDINDPIKLGQALNTLFANTKANEFANAISTVVNRQRLHKDEAQILKVLDPDGQYANKLRSISFAMSGLTNSFRNLGAAIFMGSAGDMAGAMTAMSRAVNHLATSISAHPWLGKAITGLGVALSGLVAVKLGGVVTSMLGLSAVFGAPVVAVGTVLGALYFLREWNPLDIVGKVDAINAAVGRFSDLVTSKMDIEGWLERTFGTPADVGAKFTAMARAGYDALVSFDWGAAGRAIVDKIGAGLSGLAGKFKGAALGIGGAINGVEGWIAGKLGLGVQPKEAPLPGHALGGLIPPNELSIVGEHGPELFWSGRAGGLMIPNGSFQGLAGLPGLAGGFGGGGGGSWNGSMGRVGGPSIGHTSSQEERAVFIKSYAESIGIDPAVALRVAQSEGFYSFTGDHGMSHGDFQMYLGGGLGNIAERMGVNTRDPNNWKESDRFALDWAAKHGWGDWHGAARVGISHWQGINAKAVAAAAAGGRKGARVTHVSNAPVVHIHGATDPRAVEAKVYDVFRKLEREQRAAFND